jgi:hypothetical protein
MPASNATINPPTTDTASKSTPVQPRLRYVNFEGTFNGSLPLSDASIAQGYDGDIKLFQMDLISVARYYLNALVHENLLASLKEKEEAKENSNPMLMGSSSEGATSGGATNLEVSIDTVNSFATNNQEDNVDEADIIKSDGTTGTSIIRESVKLYPNISNFVHADFILVVFCSVCSVW